MILEQIAKSLANLDKEETISLTVQAILEGEAHQKIVLQGLFPGLDAVAKRYKKEETTFQNGATEGCLDYIRFVFSALLLLQSGSPCTDSG